MGSALSDEPASAPSDDTPSPDFPVTGRAMTVRVQCSHNGKGIDISGHFGCGLTSDWTVRHLKETIEVLTAVHRKCQRLMFAGKVMKDEVTLQAMIGAKKEQLPDRVAIFMLVDRDVFPEKLGPFRTVVVPVGVDDFVLPELTEEFATFGFYFEMRTSVLGRHGLKLAQAANGITGLNPQDSMSRQTSPRDSGITGQLSPIHPLTLDSEEREAFSIPAEAKELAWSYPVAEWDQLESDAYSLDDWDRPQGGTAMKSFLTVGGFVYLNGSIAGVTTFGRAPGQDEDHAGCMQFGPARKWEPSWTNALAEHGRFHCITMKRLQEFGARRFCWLRPREVIPGAQAQPEVPHGGFAYLFHDNVLSASAAELALDRYFPVSSATKGASSSSAGKLFRPLTLVDCEIAEETRPPLGVLAEEEGDQSP